MISVPADTPVRLVVDRQEDVGCSDQIAVPQMGVLEDLAAFDVTTIELPPAAQGTYTLTCGMGMMSGRIVSGVVSPGIGGSLPVALGVIAVVVAGGTYAFVRKRRPGERGTDASCPNPQSGDGDAEAAKILGFAPQELILLVTAVAAAIVAGLLLGGTVGQ